MEVKSRESTTSSEQQHALIYHPCFARIHAAGLGMEELRALLARASDGWIPRFSYLPDECVEYIAQYCGGKDLLALECVSRQCRDVASRDAHWERCCVAEWNVKPDSMSPSLSPQASPAFSQPPLPPPLHMPPPLALSASISTESADTASSTPSPGSGTPRELYKLAFRAWRKLRREAMGRVAVTRNSSLNALPVLPRAAFAAR
mmetsp:Transcript_29110/g.94941  ORF Transcript_29110/g.94941 Transcript_29110/m.94941 type:complete len:204 (-) Transcript_29110:75-686(-)